MIIRIDKYLADMGVGTRSEIKTYIKKGRVAINDVIIKDSAIKIDTGKDSVAFDGKVIEYLEYEYYIINKPAGVISATEDRNQKTVLDLIDHKRDDLFPVGRLDKDTEGLLLITNDGMLAHNLLSPRKHVDKKYFLRVDGILKKEFVEEFRLGLQVDEEFKALPARLDILSENEAYITIKEGKFHQIKRMMEAVGCTVIYLKRLSMGSLNLPEELNPGEYRKLTDIELSLLRGENVK